MVDMIRQRWSAWLGVGIVATVLTIIALGHPGPAVLDQKFLLNPFVEYTAVFRCLAQGCDSTPHLISLLVINGIGNIVVFMPLGVMLYISLQGTNLRPPLRIPLIGALGMAVSAIYEIIQIGIPGRVVAIGDVFTNATGIILGAYLAQMGITLWQRRRSDPLIEIPASRSDV